MSKIAAVLAHLKRGRTITSMQAFEQFRATRLADIVFKLRGHGHNVTTEMVENGSTRYARYRLVPK